MSIILRVGAVKSSRVHETHYGSGDEASSYTDADVLDIPLPEHTYQRPHPPPSTHAHCNAGYFGLPYQDHNYGMPPPPSPPRPASPRPSSPLQVNGVVQMEEEVKTTPFVSVVEEVVEDSVTRCICGYLHDDGYMICCDRCSVWQHIDCMGVDRNNIPESYFCELCQPRQLDALKAKILQKRKREELAARNVLSDSSATDTDPEEAANALAAMGKKLPTCKKKTLKHKRSPKVKEKQSPLKLKIGKGITHKKVKKAGKKEKENIKVPKPRKIFKSGPQKLKQGTSKNRPLLTLEQLSGDPWNSNLSPWVDTYEVAHENQYSPAVRELSFNSHLISQSLDTPAIVMDQLLAHVVCVADVKKHRKGLKAIQEIPAGQAIIEYKGRVVLRHDYDKEHAFINSFKKLQPFVLFYSKLDVDLCVDARVYGNDARFVRRSCCPNSEVQHAFSQGNVYFVIVSRKEILAGSEITIPFDYNYENCCYYVECACTKSSCMVSKFWKRLKNAQKSPPADISVKRKRQPSGKETCKINLEEKLNSSSSQGSPTKASMSPVKALQMKLTTAAASSPHPPISSPIKLSNVCTLLAASALLDGQPELATSLKLEVPELLPQTPTPQPALKSVTTSRRASRLSEDSIKEEKPAVAPVVQVKEKHKTKEPKLKDKENKDSHLLNVEVKKERRPSLRRHSQEDLPEIVDLKPEALVPAVLDSEDTHSSSECPRKLTREERKLDAIMKAFEKMEKREERRKEAMARGDCGTKKCHLDTKIKKHETDGAGSCGTISNSHNTSQDSSSEAVDLVKTEPEVDDHEEMKTSEVANEVKPETAASVISPESGSNQSAGAAFPLLTLPAQPEAPAAVKVESPQKTVRKSDKRKRRKSRVQSTTAIPDMASVSTDEGNSNSNFPVGPVSVPTTPCLVPVNTSVQNADIEDGLFKYIKTKKHLFEEWASRQEDESKHEEEIFVQCLPNPHVNTMDHLQRRHSHSVSSCSSRNTESSAGSAKKRWLRQAMHEVPSPVAFNSSLSVSTEYGSMSPVHGGASPNPGTCLASPGASSPLDFVTPLKKRRLMRESVSNEPSNGLAASASSRVLADSFTPDSLSITTKTNGVKQFFPAHRHSTDDRLLLHKGYPHQNGFREVLNLPDEKITAPTHSGLNSSASGHEVNGLDLRCTLPELKAGLATEPMPVTVSFPHVNGVSDSVPISSVSLLQSNSQYALKFRGIFERMEVGSSDETFKGSEIHPTASSSKMEENGVCPPKPSLREFEEDNRIDSSASATTVVVVNSSVYTSVNNLMDEDGEAGYVTAKSIMNVDSPAPVRVDLNAHEIEPSLDDDSSVVTFNDRFFNRSSSEIRTLDIASECQVNSSEDIFGTRPLASENNKSDVCDNICMESTSTQAVVGIHGEEVSTRGSDVEEEQDIVDSSQHVNSENRESAAVFREENANNHVVTMVQPVTSVCVQTYAECISSSGQMNSSMVESNPEEASYVCDSVEESSDSVLQLASISRQCDTAVGEVPLHSDYDDSSADGEDIRTCDSVGGDVTLLQHPTRRSTDEEAGDDAVSESHCSEPQFFVSAADSNVDSTSSETNRGVCQLTIYSTSVSRKVQEVEAVVADGCCDSNYERSPDTDAVYDSSATGDESSLEGLCVSSSNAMDLQNSNSWESYSKETFPAEVLPERAVSTVTRDYGCRVSQSMSAAERYIKPVLLREQQDHSAEVGPSSGPSAVCSKAFTANSMDLSNSSSSRLDSFCTKPLFLSTSLPSSSSSSSSALNPEGTLSSTLTSPTSGQQTVTASGAIVSQTIISSPPSLSTAEATPAVKKKVSLLEYRKRLKDKPVLSSASETKMSSAASTASSSTHHQHKLSPTLSMYLASSPTSSASSPSPSKSPSSSSHSQKKYRMPTLATLPLFKDADGKKGEESEVASSSGGIDETVLPPPPPPPPPPLPQAPTAGPSYRLPAPGAGYTTPPSHPEAGGFHGIQGSVVNGGPGSYYMYHQQQTGISSTTLSSLPSSLGHGGRDLHVPRFPGSSGAPGPASSHPSSTSYQPHLQQQPSSTSHVNPALSQTWPVNQGPVASALPPPLPTNIHHLHHPPSQQYDFNQWPSSQSQTVISENVSEDHPPPPPPLSLRPHHQPVQVSSSSSSSSSSSQHRHHHHHSSSGKSKSSKAASLSSSSHYSDNRSRH
ncbi:hypothetical protein BsWGS_13399 [Bradybaena similaris]